MTTDEATAVARRAVEGDHADLLLERLAARIGARAGVEAVFGEPIRSGDVTIVPVARIRWGVGAGGGTSDVEGAAGSGGGGGVFADPVGYVEITPAGAAFRPIERAWTSPVFVLSIAAGVAFVLRALSRLFR